MKLNHEQTALEMAAATTEEMLLLIDKVQRLTSDSRSNAAARLCWGHLEQLKAAIAVDLQNLQR